MPTPRAALSFAMLALACGPDADPAILPIDEPIPGPSPRTQVRSCPTAMTPVPTSFDPRLAVGEAGGVTWLFGQFDNHSPVLAHLAADGTLAAAAVPLAAQAGAIAGASVWLYAPRRSDEVPARWVSVDVGDPEHPVVGAVAPLLVDGVTLTDAAAFAVSERRALLVTGERAARQLILLDPATRAAVAPPHALGEGFDPLHAACTADSCVVVAMTDDETHTHQRLVVLRVLPDGSSEREPLAPVWAGRPHAADLGDRVIVSWPDEHDLNLHVLDRQGRSVGPTVPVPWDSDHWNRKTALLRAGGAVMLAIAETDDRWSVAPVGPHGTIGPRRRIPGADLQNLVGVPMDDGLVWLGFGGEVSHNEFGSSVLTQTWRAEVTGGFLPISGDPAPLRQFVRGDGDGDGRFEPHILVRPGAAAALIVPRGDADHDSDPVLVPLRAACPPPHRVHRSCAEAGDDAAGCGPWFSRVLPFTHLGRATLAGLRNLRTRAMTEATTPTDDRRSRCET